MITASLKLASSGSIALGAFAAKKKHSYAAILCPNLLTPPSAAAAKTAPFQRPGAKTRSKNGFVGIAATLSIVLWLLIKKEVPLLDTLPCFSLSQSPSTAELLENE